MKPYLRWPLLAALTAFPPGAAVSAREAGIPVVGRDAAGRSQLRELSRGRYTELLGGAARAADASVLDAVAAVPAPARWRLTMIVIGLGMEIDAGIGPLVSFKVSPQFNLIYSNKKGPAIP